MAITALLFVGPSTKESHAQHDPSTMNQGFDPDHLVGGGDQQLLFSASCYVAHHLALFYREGGTLPSLFFLSFISDFPQSFDIRARSVVGGCFSLPLSVPFLFCCYPALQAMALN